MCPDMSYTPRAESSKSGWPPCSPRPLKSRNVTGSTAPHISGSEPEPPPKPRLGPVLKPLLAPEPSLPDPPPPRTPDGEEPPEAEQATVPNEPSETVARTKSEVSRVVVANTGQLLEAS